MIAELIGAIVANGTTAGSWGYSPWLPFYNFFPVIFMASVVTFIVVNFFQGFMNASKYTAILISSSLFAVLPTWLMWTFFEIGPDLVLLNWVIWLMILYLMNMLTFPIIEELY